ncbi:MAG: hypothetical protein OQL11_05905 [Gammaproteobacteria bacterium]|nr:hypothetical protein [Gammaproteobacteria bacterium]
MIQDSRIQAAVSRIMQRSERQTDIGKLVSTYVDVGLLPQLHNRNHQIFYGRRGTGKTHVLKVLETEFRNDESLTVVYIDCRTLGSTTQFCDASLPMGRRCLALFRDFLLAIHHSLLEHIVEAPNDNATQAFEAADQLSALITEPLTTLKANRMEVEAERTTTSGRGANVNVRTSSWGPGASFAANVSEGEGTKAGSNTEYLVESEDKIIFPELHQHLRRVLALARTNLVVLVDEWSSLPADVQPYLAEFLKRGILPLNEATLKISALEYRCRFVEGGADNYVGFELGADIATAPDLDDYFVYDRNPQHITDVYADVLYRHLSSELDEGYLREHGVSSGRQLASRLFTERATCGELARSCEGVVRDLINIFTKAFFDAHRRGRDTIDKQAVLDSARQWFEQDKAQYLDEVLQTILRRIVDDVIGKRKARSFLLPRELERHPIVQRLFDARVIHHMQRGYADKDNPGVRYNIYSIDYGTYVDLLGTTKEPELDLVERAEPDVVVPFDDKRSIRRIVLNPEVLEA